MISTLQQAVEYLIDDRNKSADILTWAWQRHFEIYRSDGYSIKQARKCADVFIGKGSPIEKLSIEMGHDPTTFMLNLATELIKEYDEKEKTQK